MGQLERGLNRIYGIEQDRPTLQKYGRAFLLALTRGLARRARRSSRLGVRRRRRPRRSATTHRGHDLERRPVAARRRAPDRRRCALLFRWCAAPAPAGLVVAARSARSVAVVLWSLVTLALGPVLPRQHLVRRRPTARSPASSRCCCGRCSPSIAVLFGAALSAQLEAVRAGAPQPQDAEKIERVRARTPPRSRRACRSSRGVVTAVVDRRTGRDATERDRSRVRRALEGVIGVPATEGNRIDVLRNGDEIFPAMLDAIEARRAHDRLPDVRVLGAARSAREFAERSRERAARRRAGARAPRRVGRAPDRPATLIDDDGGRRRAASAGSGRSRRLRAGPDRTTARTARC